MTNTNPDCHYANPAAGSRRGGQAGKQASKDESCRLPVYLSKSGLIKGEKKGKKEKRKKRKKEKKKKKKGFNLQASLLRCNNAIIAHTHSRQRARLFPNNNNVNTHKNPKIIWKKKGKCTPGLLSALFEDRLSRLAKQQSSREREKRGKKTHPKMIIYTLNPLSIICQIVRKADKMDLFWPELEWVRETSLI